MLNTVLNNKSFKCNSVTVTSQRYRGCTCPQKVFFLEDGEEHCISWVALSTIKVPAIRRPGSMQGSQHQAQFNTRQEGRIRDVMGVGAGLESTSIKGLKLMLAAAGRSLCVA